MRAAAERGDGLYGVDLKDVDGRAIVIEINDNPSIDAGVEDQVLVADLLGLGFGLRNKLRSLALGFFDPPLGGSFGFSFQFILRRLFGL